MALWPEGAATIIVPGNPPDSVWICVCKGRGGGVGALDLGLWVADPVATMFTEPSRLRGV